MLALFFGLFLFPSYSFATITSVTTLPQTEISDVSARLNGSGNVTGTTSNYAYFRYSKIDKNPPVYCNDTFGAENKATNEIAVNGSVSFHSTITGLEPNTTYSYCAVISNNVMNYKKEISYGVVKTFTTKPCLTCGQTMINTTYPLVVSGSNVYLNGFYNSTETIKTYFEYRKILSVDVMNTQVKSSTTSNWIQVSQQNKAPNTAGAFTFLLTNLTPNTQYEYRAVGEVNPSNTNTHVNYNPNIIYGEILNFTTKDNAGSNGGGGGYDGGGDGGGGYGPYPNLPNLPETPPTHPPIDAVVHYAEGVENVFIRQIAGNVAFAKVYGYRDGMNMQSFAYGLAHTFAQLFGYVHGGAHEIRVSTPDVAAYILGLKDGKLVVFKYYKGYYTGTDAFTINLNSAFGYEYYFNRKLK